MVCVSGNVSEWILNTYRFTHVDDRILKGRGWYQTNGFTIECLLVKISKGLGIKNQKWRKSI
jgi:hypothetical protein